MIRSSLNANKKVMKKVLLFLCLVFVSLTGFARNASLPTPNQVLVDTVIATYTSACNGTTINFPMLPSLGFQTSCSYSFLGVRYYTTEPYFTLTFNLPSDTTIMCYVDSVNGIPLTVVVAIVFSVHHAPTITIDSIKHVTCPDGYLHPYMDGSFHVDLNDPVQDYGWITAEAYTPFFYGRTFYDSVTLTGLRAGTYHVTAHGTNGCEYHDSVTIVQPEPWVDTGVYADTVCANETGCINLGLSGGTTPYDFTWYYYADTGQVFLPDTTCSACGLSAGGTIYFVNIYDSRGCKFFGDETEFFICYLFEYAEDPISLSATNFRVCYGGVDTLHAQSIGYETGYLWHVGDLEDSVNYFTWTETDSVYIAEYLTPPMTASTWVSVDFSDQHGCVTHDSVWVEVYNPDVSMTVQTPQIFTDSTFVIYVSPPGGDLYIDDVLLVSSIPSVFTVSTNSFSVGEHVLKYSGVFGAEVGLACEDEISLPIQVEINPLVTDWKYEISIYPNPATTTLNLSSTGTSDFGLSILDMTGKVIKAEKMLDQTFTFDVSDLASGIYMLRLVSRDGASKIVKFVKR